MTHWNTPTPRKYPNATVLLEAINAWYLKCKKEEKPLSLTGLALGLGFSSLNSLYNYEKNPVFADVIRYGRLLVENGYEEQLSWNIKGSPAGPIFALKNMGWTDRPELREEKPQGNMPWILAMSDKDLKEAITKALADRVDQGLLEQRTFDGEAEVVRTND